MMKRSIIMMLGLMAAVSVSAKDDCDPAVDAADSMNVNQQDCDYSDKGLNGFLQKAFKKGEEGAVLETGSAEKNSTGKVQPALAKVQKSDSHYFTLSVEVDQWANVPLARTQLFPKALERCGKGFAVTGEHYRSLAMGRIELSLQFECDN
ncbi:hypothetical protein [Cellvibrio sp. OA-2007]|uniref:hypothetical protein n=2 Tax=Cellvibrio sp. OA-2007 TaxID=529823 RepID=UPI0030DB6BB5